MPARSTNLALLAIAATALSLVAYGRFKKSKKKKQALKKTMDKSRSSSRYFHPSPPLNEKDDGYADFLEGDTVVLDERRVMDPSKEEVERVANAFGLSLAVAKKLLSDPLPDGWKACKLVELSHSEDEMVMGGFDIHSVYYFNFDTGESSWDHPLVVKFKGKQDEKEKLRFKEIEAEKQSRRKLQDASIAKKRERMERRLSAIAKKPVSLEKMFAGEDEIVITSKIIMDTFDTNRDGVLSKKEFTNGLKGVDPKSKVGKHLIEIFGINWRQKKEVTTLFKEIDIDGDGTLTLDELTIFVEKLDESADAHRTILARRMSSVDDDTKAKAIFDKYKNDKGFLEISNLEKMWKELGSELAGKPFSDKQCKKWAARTMKKLAKTSDTEYDVENGITFETFNSLSASGPLFEICTKRI